ncbi:MAG: tetratricopeptide repeat protein [Gammaproteobacteria bacterium]|jgi:predicted O-linked N-acetylglucosamine transferase (SPINDLY family)
MSEKNPSPDESEIARLLTSALTSHQAGNLAEAESGYRRVLGLARSHPDALRLLGVLCYQTGRMDEALKLLECAIDSAPDNVDALCNMGLVLSAEGSYQKAEEVLRRAIRLDPVAPASYNTLGGVLLAVGDLKRAVGAYRKATELAPAFVEGLVNLANALLLSGRPDLARSPCRQAISLAGELPEAHIVMGNIHASLDEKDSAIASFHRACKLSPDQAEPWCNLASALEAGRKWDQALDCFDRAIALNPDLGPAISGGLLLRKSLLSWDDLDAWSARFSAGIRKGLAGLTPFIYLAEPSSARDQLDCARVWSRHIEKRVAPLRARLDLDHPRVEREQITVGYFSHDFRRHPTAYTKVGLFENHDRSGFRVLGYCNGPDDGSNIRQRVVDSFDRFTDVAGWPPGDVARQIHADGVDILVDLKGHTRDAPTDVFALRPAPIQVNYKGYPGTIGGSFIDYIVADEFVIPPEQRDCYSEQVVYLPETYWVDDSRRTLPGTPPGREKLGLPSRGTVFCGFNNSYKIRPEVFDDWVAIVRDVPGSVLWIQNTNPDSSLADNLRSEAARRHLATDRLVFAPKMPLRDYLAMMTVADLFLDTRPYNGHTTASDALWAGLPVLTLPGETFASRVAGSMLRTLGLHELIARNRDDYRAVAIRLGRDADERARLRRRLEAARRCTPLYDTARLTRHMELAYRTMYRNHLAGASPRSFKVPPLPASGS